MGLMMPGAEAASGTELKKAWENLNCSLRKLRSSDAASKLGVSEGELIASLCGTRALRLRNMPSDLMRDVASLGPVTAVTRNTHCVHEKTGPYRNISVEGTTGLVLGKEIDLRLFLRQWQHAFVVFEMSDCAPRRSLQFFDAQGCVVHKIFQHSASDTDAFDRFVERWRSEDQTPHMAIAVAPEKQQERADAEIDQGELRAAWLALEDTHDFFGLLQRFGAGRQQALRLGGEDLARPLDGQVVERLFQAAKDSALPLMVFVGNSGCIQIHTGPINALTAIGPWLNAAGENFRLHLRQDMIAAAYAVRKPTKDGDIHSLELFDAGGFCFAQIFGARKPGKPELAGWRNLITQL